MTKKMKSTSSLFERRLGLRWGRLLSALQAAKYSAAVAYGERSLPPKDLAEELQDLHHRLDGLEQAAWGVEQKGTE